MNIKNEGLAENMTGDENKAVDIAFGMIEGIHIKRVII